MIGEVAYMHVHKSCHAAITHVKMHTLSYPCKCTTMCDEMIDVDGIKDLV